MRPALVAQTEAVDLTTYRALSFDCYGTLIDWETGLLAVLRPWANEVALDLDDEGLLAAYGPAESATEADRSSDRYPAILAATFRRLGRALDRPVTDGWADRLGASVPDWPAFPDSAAALDVLARHYLLVIVSNVHRDGFAASNERLGGRFAAVITAEDVGAYKPADPPFEALLRTIDELDVERSQLLHVAQSLFHDHGPAARHRVASAWIDRRHDRSGTGATPAVSATTYGARFESMADFAAAVTRAFAGPGLSRRRA